MAWPQSSPAPRDTESLESTRPALALTPAIGSVSLNIPPRPSSVEYPKAARERFISLPASSSPMLLSANRNVKKGSAHKGDRRESAPPASRSAAYSPLSSPITGLGGDHQPKPRPRSNSNVQISPYTQASYFRPLPALPTSGAASRENFGDSIKVPVDDNSASPSPYITNVNSLHPNSYASQVIPRELGQNDRQDPNFVSSSREQGGSVVYGAANSNGRPLERQSNDGSSGRGHSPTSTGLRQPLNHCAASHSTHPPVHMGRDRSHDRLQANVPGRGYGDNLSSEEKHLSQNKWDNDVAPGTSRRLSSPSLPPHHINLLQGEVPRPHERSMSALSTTVSRLTTSRTTTEIQHSPRLSNCDATLSPSTALSSSMNCNSAVYPRPPSSASPSLPSQQQQQQVHQSLQSPPLDSNLQPYYPPPTLSNPSSQYLPHHGYTGLSAVTLTTSAPTTPTSVTYSPAPAHDVVSTSHIANGTNSNRSKSDTAVIKTAATLTPRRSSRRHSSSTRPPPITTQSVHSVKKGPRTADAGIGGGGSSKCLEPDGPVRSSVRSQSRSNQPSSRQLSPSPSSHLPPSQSPNRLVIPHSTKQPSHQHESPAVHHQQQHQHRYMEQATQSSHQQQQRISHKSSTGLSNHSPRSPRSPSPLSPRSHQHHHQQHQHHQHHLQQEGNRTAMTMMQRYLTHPDDPDSEADIAVQIMISQAAVDSKGFEILMPQTVETVKRHHATLISRIAALTARLSLESKIREAAQSLLKLHADNKKLARQASDHLEAANQKVDQVATELWKLTQLAADLQRTLLQHTSGVLALGVVRLEDQGRREREMHVVQLQEARVGRDVEDQFESMAKVIMSLESGALEAQKLLEDKDRAIERLLKQLEHQRDLFIKLDEQQRKTMALSRSQRKSLEASGGTGSDAKTIAKLSDFLSSVQKQLQQILQQQQQQVSTTKRQRNTPADQQDVDGSPVSDDSATEAPQQRDGFAQTCPSNSTMMSRTSPSVGSLREDSMSSGPSDRSYRTTGIHAGSDTLMDSPTPTTPLGPGTTPFSMEGIQSTLDALKSHVTESKQKITTLEGELGLMRRQSVVMSASRNNSIKIKNFSTSSSRGHQAEETIRSALEKSLKDALLAKEMAQLELENERQKWQEDQNHRISALEESLVAVEDLDKDSGAKSRTGAGGMVSAVGLDTTRDDRMLSRDETVKELRRQLRDAMEDIDSLSLQQQSSLKAMRQLFDLLPNSRRRSHMQLFESHQQSQQEIATSLNDQSRKSDMADPSSSSSSSPPAFSAIGFSMEALISRVKDLVTSSQQIEQDNAELRQQVGKPMIRSRQTSSQNLAVSSNPGPQGNSESRGQSTWMLNSDLERLQANAGMVQLLEKELELLKQHTDVLMDENARLADLAAASATNTPVQVRSSVLGRIVQKPSQDDKLNELQKIIRAKDELLLERDQIVQDLEKSLQQTQLDLTQARAGTGDTTAEIADGISRPDSPLLSTFDINAAEEMRIKCEKLEEEMGEMRMVVAALESVNGGPGTGLQLLKGLAASSNSQSSSSSSWLGSTLGAVGSLSFGSFSQRNSIETASSATSPVPSTVDMSNNDNKSNTLSPGGSGSNNAAVTGATAALRKEFRRAMGELREEKEKAVRKEIEERRRLERELRKLRRELQIAQTTTQA